MKLCEMWGLFLNPVCLLNAKHCINVANTSIHVALDEKQDMGHNGSLIPTMVLLCMITVSHCTTVASNGCNCGEMVTLSS